MSGETGILNVGSDTDELARLARLTDIQTVTIDRLQRELCEARQRLQDGHERLQIAGGNIKRLCDALENATNDLESCTAALAETEADNVRLRAQVARQWQPIETISDRMLDNHALLLAGGVRSQRVSAGMMPRALAGWEKWWLLVSLPAPLLETAGG